MLSGPVAESELRLDSKLSIMLGEKDTESRNSWVRLGKVGTESDGFGTQDLEANTEFRHSAFSRAVSAMQPFEVREGMEGEHPPQTDLIRRHQHLEEGDGFESSDLRLERLFSGYPEGRYTLFPSFVEGIKIAFSWISLP